MMRAQTAFAAMLALVAGCSTLPDRIATNVGEADAQTSRLMKQVGDPTGEVFHHSGIWIGKTALKLDKQAALPAIFDEPTSFDRSVHSLSELAERITLRSGIPVKVTPEAAAAAYRAVTPGAGSGPSAPVAGTKPAAATVPPASAGATAGAVTPPVRLIYPSGTLKGFLDTAAARLGVYWKFHDGAILMYYTDTRSFRIAAVPGESALTATVASSSSAGDSGGAAPSSGAAGSSGQGNSITSSNSQNTAVKSQLSVYAGLEKAVGSMLSQYGQAVASPATGSITVTDTPDRLDRIARFIEIENEALSRQVMINVTVLAVARASGDSFGINWNLVYGDLFRKYGVQNTRLPENSATTFSAGILNTSDSKWAGSSLLIDALASQGQVRRETSASVVTLNNQPVPVQVAKQTSYLRSIETTISANVGSTTSLTPGVVVSGLNMTILPHVLDNGTVLLQFSTDISSLRQIRTVTSSQSSIESPELDTRNFLQRVALRSNETLIISGFEQTDDNLDRQGTLRPSNMLFGGGYKAQSSKEVLVILITPVVMGARVAEQ